MGILAIRSEVVPGSILCGTRNHYIDLRYYHCSDPLATNPQWQQVVIMHNDRACIQPLGNILDPSGRIHLLYCYTLDDGHGQPAGPAKLVYAASRELVSSTQEPQFVQHELPTPGDGRLFLTRDGAVHVVAYSDGGNLYHARVLDGVAGTFTPWKSFAPGISLGRLFPIDARNGSTLSDDLAAVLIPSTNTSPKDSLFYFFHGGPRINRSRTQIIVYRSSVFARVAGDAKTSKTPGEISSVTDAAGAVTVTTVSFLGELGVARGLLCWS